jgi:hypothetical protein
MQFWSVQSEQEERQLFRLQPLLACEQAKCLGGVEAASLHTLMPLSEHVPAPPVATLGQKVQWCLCCLVIPSRSLDMARDTQRFLVVSPRYPACSLVIVLADRGAHPHVLPRCNIGPDHSACILKDGDTAKAANSSYHLENLNMCLMQQIMILVACHWVKISRDVAFSATGYLFVWPTTLHYHARLLHIVLLQQMIGDCFEHGTTSPTYFSSNNIGMTTTGLVFLHLASWRYGCTVAQSKRQHYFCSFIPILFSSTQMLVDGRDKWTEMFSSDSMLPRIIEAAYFPTEIMFPDLSVLVNICESFLPQPFPNFVVSLDANNGGLVMLSISVPWDPSACNELSTEELKSECAQQPRVYSNHLGKKHGSPHKYIASWPKFLFAYGKNGFILERMSCWVMTVWLQANKFSEVQLIHQTTVHELLVGQLMSFTWSSDSMLLLCQYRLPDWYAVCSLWFKLGPTWTNTDISCKTSVSGSAGIAEPVPLFDEYAVISLSQMLFIMHLYHFSMKNWIQAPSATWCYWLLLGVTEQWTMLQTVQPICVESALLLELPTPLQPKHDGWVILRKVLPATHRLLHCRGDRVQCIATSPITMPWDPGTQPTHINHVLLQPVIAFWGSCQVGYCLGLWDPDGFTLTLGLRASRNLRRGECHGLYLRGWAVVAWAGFKAHVGKEGDYKGNRAAPGRGGTELTDELYSP